MIEDIVICLKFCDIYTKRANLCILPRDMYPSLRYISDTFRIHLGNYTKNSRKPHLSRAGGWGANDNKFISSNWRGRQDTAWTTSTNTTTETTQETGHETGTKRDAQESYSRKRTSQVFAQQAGARVHTARATGHALLVKGLYCASSHHAKSTRPSAPIIFNHLRRHHLQIPPTHNRGSLSALCVGYDR